METDERRGGEGETDGELCFIREELRPTAEKKMKKEKKRGFKNNNQII